MKHTPEPWHVTTGSIYSPTGATIAHMHREPERGNTIRPVERDENARHIVACVNACAGIENPEALPEALTAAQNLIHMYDNLGEFGITEVSAARDVLSDALAALRGDAS